MEQGTGLPVSHSKLLFYQNEMRKYKQVLQQQQKQVISKYLPNLAHMFSDLTPLVIVTLGQVIKTNSLRTATACGYGS